MGGCSPDDPNARETPTEKTEWSVLQAVEYQNRSTLLRQPEVRQLQGYEVLGVRGVKGSNVWVLLKPGAPPYYKQVPEENYAVPKSLVDQLRKERRLSYAVETVLLSRIE